MKKTIIAAAIAALSFFGYAEEQSLKNITPNPGDYVPENIPFENICSYGFVYANPDQTNICDFVKYDCDDNGKLSKVSFIKGVRAYQKLSETKDGNYQAKIFLFSPTNEISVGMIGFSYVSNKLCMAECSYRFNANSTTNLIVGIIFTDDRKHCNVNVSAIEENECRNSKRRISYTINAYKCSEVESNKEGEILKLGNSGKYETCISSNYINEGMWCGNRFERFVLYPQTPNFKDNADTNDFYIIEAYECEKGTDNLTNKTYLAIVKYDINETTYRTGLFPFKHGFDIDMNGVTKDSPMLYTIGTMIIYDPTGKQVVDVIDGVVYRIVPTIFEPGKGSAYLLMVDKIKSNDGSNLFVQKDGNKIVMRKIIIE